MRLSRFLAFLFGWLALSAALAQTPNLNILRMNGGIKPAVSTDFTTLSTLYNNPNYAFSRGGNATITDATGKITYAPNNLLTWSNDFSNAAWTKSVVSLGGTSTAPNGVVGTLLIPNTSNAVHVLQQAVTTSSNGIIAFMAKGDGTYNSVAVANAPNNWVYFDLTNGNISSLGTGWGFAGTKSLGGGWYLCWAGQQTSAPFVNVYTYPVNTFNANGNTAPSFAGDGTHGVYIAAVTVSAVTYETTPRPNDQVITTSSAFYGAAFPYDPASLAALGLRVEEARTNVALYNRDWTNAVWSKSSTTAAKTATGIDGVANSASLLTASGANGTAVQAITLASNAYDFSVYIQRVTGSGEVDITMNGGSTWTAANSSICTNGSTTSNLTTSNYVRCSITSTVTNPSVGVRLVVNGDAVNVDGGQLE